MEVDLKLYTGKQLLTSSDVSPSEHPKRKGAIFIVGRDSDGINSG